MSAETAQHALTWAHDFYCANPDDIDLPALANLMRLVKEPNAEGVSAMSAIVWEAIQKSNAQVRLELAAKLLTLGVDIGPITQATGLSEEEVRDQLALSTP